MVVEGSFTLDAVAGRFLSGLCQCRDMFLYISATMQPSTFESVLPSLNDPLFIEKKLLSVSTA